MNRLCRSLAFGVLAIGSTPALAQAYCRSTTCVGDCPRDLDTNCKTTGQPLFWAGGCIGFSIARRGSVNVDFSDIEQVTIASYVAWSDLPCDTGNASLGFSRLADSDDFRAEYDPGGENVNLILFQDTRWDYEGVENSLARTTVSYDPDTGEILDADIEMNHAFNEFTVGEDYVAYDMQSIMTHEVGHFIGLDHTLDPSATMNAGYIQGSVDPRTLEDDDIAAACAVYDPRRTVGCRPSASAEEPSGCSATPTAPNDQRWLAPWLGLLWLGWSRCRR